MNAVAKCSILAWTLSAACACGAGLLPYGLECEARQNPVGIDVPKPRLGWKLRSDQQNQTQGAYQVAVATSPERLASGTPDAWDSGRVASEQQSWIEYRGAPLRSFQRYWWKVRVWDGAGTDAGWSQPAEWTTALVDPGLRRGSWIASPNTSLRSGPLPVFRKEFTVEKPVRQAVAMVSGAGFHELHVNGAKVGDRVLAPAWTNFRSTVLYETFDVSPLLKTGRNALGIMLGNGFYNVAGGRYAKYTGSFGQPRLWMQLHLEYADGTSADIATDSNWKVHDGPLTFSCIYGGEDYDARLELPGWDKPGFDDSAWPRPEGMEAPGGVLRSQSSPPVRVQRTFHPVKTTQPKPGVYVYDLGQNFSGWPKITVAGPAGAQVRLTPGELLDANGLVTQHSSGGPVYFSYVLKGSRAETWSPRFSYYGFRYVQVEGAAPAAETAKGAPVMQELEGQFVHLDAPPAGQFTCSNELLNRIHTLIDVAVRSNLQHVLTDCPHREKLGWLEQTYLMGPSLLYDWDLRTMLPKMVRDMREAQTVDGLVPDIAPEYVTFGGGFRDSPEWGSAGVLVPWLAWQWYGDWRGLEEAYPMMKRYAGYLESQARSGLLTYGLGDWYDIGPKPPGYSQLTPQGVTGTATWWRDLRALEQAARLLGRDSDAEAFRTQAAATLDTFQKAFFHAAVPTYATGSQTSLAIPLALGMAPEASRRALAERLVADIRSRGNHTNAGDIGYTYVLSALLDAGRSDVIFDMATQPKPPSYAAQLAAGATSLTEAWDANPDSSQNHFMLGHVEQWFYAGLAGIRVDPASPGLTRLIIAPQPVGDVSWVKASWETFRGAVSVDWRVKDGVFQLEVAIPPGITAEVRLPDGHAAQIGSGVYRYTAPARDMSGRAATKGSGHPDRRSAASAIE